MSLADHQNIFFLGIKGTAHANLAAMLVGMGKTVTGCDTAEPQITDSLLKQIGIESQVGFDISLVPNNVSLIIYSAAHGGTTNPLIVEAQKKGIEIWHHAKLIGEIAKLFKTSIAICGCHGKTTTTALTAYTLEALDKHPSWMVGSSSFTGLKDGKIHTFPSGHFGGSYDYFVFEADEYGINPPHDLTSKLSLYSPTHTLCTNIDFDHPDMFVDLKAVQNVYLDFFNRSGRIYANITDSNTLFVTDQLSDPKKVTFFEKLYFPAPLPGEKYAENAGGVFALLTDLGFQKASIEKAMQGFGGVKRRFELVAEVNNVIFMDDYGHHPAEIAATIAAVRSKYPKRRLIVMFQSHTYSRTEALKQEFVTALSKADIAMLDTVFPSAREQTPDNPISAYDLQMLAVQNGITNIFAYESREKLIEAAHAIIKPGDLVLTLGAGDIYKIIPKLYEHNGYIR